METTIQSQIVRQRVELRPMHDTQTELSAAFVWSVKNHGATHFQGDTALVYGWGETPVTEMAALRKIAPLCFRTLLVLPAIGQEFDRTDISTNLRLSTTLVWLGEYTPIEAVEMSREKGAQIGLSVDVDYVELDRRTRKIICHAYAESITVVSSLVRRSGEWGRVDHKSGLVLRTENIGEVPPQEKRIFYTDNNGEPMVTPVSRLFRFSGEKRGRSSMQVQFQTSNPGW